MPEQPTRLHARDYQQSARMTALAYHAHLFRTGATGVELENIIRGDVDTFKYFDNDINQVRSFAASVTIVQARSAGGNVGADTLVFQRNGFNQFQIAIAGVVGVGPELYQTITTTSVNGYNYQNFAEIKQIYQSLLQAHPTASFDLLGHSLGGQMVQVLTAQFIKDGRASQLNSLVTFGSYELNMGIVVPVNGGENVALLDILRGIERNGGPGFVHFANEYDVVSPRIGIDSILHPVSLRVIGPIQPNLDTDGWNPYTHGMLTYIKATTDPDNNDFEIVTTGNRSGDMLAVAEKADADPEEADIVVTAQRRRDGSTGYRLPSLLTQAFPQVDPVTGAPLPRGLVRIPNLLATSPDVTGVVVDKAGRNVELIVKDGVVVRSIAVAGGGGVSVETDYAGGRAVNVSVRLKDNPVGIEFSDAGAVIGSWLGTSLAGGNRMVGVVTSALLKTVGDNLGDALDGIVGRVSPLQASKDGFGAFGQELKTNLTSAGVGAVSSYLTAELVKTLGVDGFAGEVLSSAGGSVINQIVSNIVANPALNPMRGLDFTKVGSALGSFLGTKLASELVTFDTVGGQIGSSLGSSLGVIGVTSAITAAGTANAALLGMKLGAFAGPVAALVGAFAGFLIGGLIGSLFGGTPRSGADVVWDPDTGLFEAANGYAKHGASRGSAMAMAQTVADTFNSVIKLTGAKLLDPAAVQAGNYGTRKADFVYRQTVNGQADVITRRFSGKKAAEQLIQFGAYTGMTDSDFKLVGGSIYAKRAFYNSFGATGMTVDTFDANILLGNLSTAARYEAYLANPAAINALIAGEPDSVLASEWAVTFARASELGLGQRHAADWYGGFGLLLQEAATVPTRGAFSLITDPLTKNVSRMIAVGDFALGDTVDVAGQVQIAGTGGADLIQAQLQNIAIAAIIDAGGGNDTVRASDRGDNVLGGQGNDVLVGGKLDDWLIGGDGDDRLFAGAVATTAFPDADAAAVNTALAADGGSGNYLDGGAGNDRLFGSAGSDWLAGGDGVDSLWGGAGGDVLDAGAGNEGGASGGVQGGAGSDQYVFRRGDGQDVYFDDAAQGATAGGFTADSISAKAKARTNLQIAKNWAGGGEFSVDGNVKGGDDAIAFGAGITMRDLLLIRSGAVGVEGMDLIIRIQRPDGSWQAGDDQIIVKDWFEGTRRIEWLRFDNGEEIRIGDFTSIQRGTAAADVLIGTGGRDFQYGGDGDDTMFGLGADDWQVGGRGDDLVSGNDDNDFELGGDGDDVVLGGMGQDTVSGDAGVDRVYGGAGDDLVLGGTGDDELVGGGGSDVFRFNRGDGRDTIFDEYAGTWELVWRDGTYRSGTTGGVAYAYAVNAATGVVTRTANGTVEVVADGAGWRGNWDYNDTGGVKSLYRLIAPATGAKTKQGAGGTDTLEFGVGIDIQDLAFRRDGDDLRVAITRSGGAIDVFDEVTDQIRLKDWYNASGTVARGIEKFLFVNTGEQLMSSTIAWGGTDGADSVSGTTGQTNWIAAGAGDDTLVGRDKADILNGNSGADSLEGGAGSDVLFGGDGDDTLAGGDDTLAGGNKADVLVGGAGLDTAKYGATAVRASLADPTLNTGDAAGDQYVGIENLTGSSAADTLYGDAGDNVLDGGAGNDSLFGGAGNDVYQLYAGMGTDTVTDRLMNGTATLAGGAGDDMVEAGAGLSLSSVGFARVGNNLELSVGTAKLVVVDHYLGADAAVEAIAFADGLVGSLVGMIIAAASGATTGTSAGELMIGRNTATADSIAGGDGADTISGRLGADTLRGGAGDDVLEGGADGDLLDGGGDSITDGLAPTGGDTIRYVASAAGVSVNLLTGAASGGDAAGDTIIGIENVTGADLAGAGDTLVGDARANVLSGLAGADSLSGGGGDDVLLGGDGNDIIDGGDGADNIDAGDGDDANVRGGAGGDLAMGGAGNDQIWGDAGSDRLDGGLGNDTLWGGTEADTLGGGDGADSLSGDAGDDRLAGGQGNDTLLGGDGADILSGDAGDDVLQGGLGDDAYAFDADAGADTITDAAGSNRVTLAGVAADRVWLTRAGGDLKIGVIGGTTRITVTGFFTGASSLREIALADASLFLKYAGGATYAGSLIEAMTAASAAPPATTAAVPAALRDRAATFWWAGGKATPSLADAAVATPEDTAVSGTMAIVDHDDNAGALTVAAQGANGTVVLVGNAWTYTPRADWSGTDSFQLSSRDADGQAATATVTVTVAAVNDAPRFDAVQPTLAVNENAANGAAIATLRAADVEGDAFTFALAGAAGAFNVSAAGVLSVRDGTLLNYEESGVKTRDVSVKITETATGLSTTRIFSVALNNVNEAPNAPVATPVTARASESAGGVGPALPGTVIASLTRSDIDGTTPTLRLRSGNAAAFDVSGGNLVFKAGYAPDFEAMALAVGQAALVDRDNDGLREVELIATVEAWDGQYASGGAATVTVGIEDVNEAPTALNLSTSPTLAERDRPMSGQSMAAVSLATLSATDPDLAIAGESFAYSVADGRFEVVGTELRLKANQALDFEAAAVEAGTGKRYLDITVTVKDRAGGAGFKQLDKAVRVYVTDVIDYAYGTAAADTLSGQAGRDIIDAGAGNDLASGGAGDDDLYGRDGADTLRGDAGADRLWGEAGNDSILGGAGADLLYGGDGDDRIEELQTDLDADTAYGGIGNDTIALGGGNDQLFGDAGIDWLYGGDGADRLDGGADNDHLFGDAGADTLLGGQGDDRLVGGQNGDQLDGGDGFDTATYAATNGNVANATPVTVDLDNVALNTGDAAGDTYLNIEAIEGSGGADALRGRDAAADVLGGAGGNDALDGRGGADTLRGGAGLDTLSGGQGDDQLFGDADADTLDGGSGDDRLVGGAGDDLLRGGSGNDVYEVARGDGNDVIDQTGAPPTDNDLLGFTGGLTNRNLWFEWAGNDVKVSAMGAAGVDATVRLKDFRTADADGRANVRTVVAGPDRTAGEPAGGELTRNVAISSLATTLDRFVNEKGVARPTTQAAFDAIMANTAVLLDGKTFEQHWTNFWRQNQAPVFTFANAPALAAGWAEDARSTPGTAFVLSFTLSDDLQSNATLAKSVTLVRNYGDTAADTSPTRLLSAIDVAWPADGAATGTVTVQGRPNASGTAFLWVHANDVGGLPADYWLPVSISAVADAPTLSITAGSGNNGPAGIAVGVAATLTDQDGSEVVDRVEIAGVPAGFAFASGDGSVSAANNLGGGTWRFSQAQLGGLRVVAPSGWSRDLTGADALRVTAWSRETATGQTAASAVSTLSVRINAAPTDIGFTGSFAEGAAAGTPVGVAVVTDPDRAEDSRLDIAGWGDAAAMPGWVFHSAAESQWLDVAGPAGQTVRALRTGQFNGTADPAGGGVGASAGVSVDANRAYRFTIYFRPEDLGKHNLYFGLSPNWADANQSFVEFGNTGDNAQNPYFLAWGPETKSALLQAGRWYRAEGYVLPQGHQLVDPSLFGGVFDVATGAKVAATQNFRWNDAMPSNQVHTRFFDFYGEGQNGWSTQWWQPAIEELPLVSLADTKGGRLAIDARSGLVTVGPTPTDFEDAAWLPAGDKAFHVNLSSTDGGGLTVNRTVDVNVGNVNERPSLTGGWGWAHFTETGLGSRPANAHVAVATLGVADPDGTVPTLEFTENPNNWFHIDQATKQIRFNPGLNFDFEWARAAGYGINDWNGNGILEAHVANVWVRATDGALASDPQLVQVFIEDVAERPNAPGLATYAGPFSETMNGDPSVQAGRTIATFGLSDPDGPAPFLRFADGGNPNGWFTVVGNELRFAGPNFTADWMRGNMPAYSLDTDGDGLKETQVATVRLVADDGREASAEISVPVFIEDVNEKPNIPALEAQNFFPETFAGQSHANQLIARFGLTDPDDAGPGLEIVGGNPHGWFQVVGGHIAFTGANFTADWLRGNMGQHGTDAGWWYDNDGDGALEVRVATLQLVARDPRGRPSDTINYNVFIEDANEAPTLNGQYFVVAENSPGAGITPAGTFTWSDPDPSPRFRSQSFAVTANNDGPMWSMDGATLRLQGALNYEAQQYYWPLVTMTDGGGLASSAYATVQVADVNEAANPSIVDGRWSARHATYYFTPNDPDDWSGFVVSNVWSDNGTWQVSGSYDAATNRIAISAYDPWVEYNSYSYGTLYATVTDRNGTGVSKSFSYYAHVDGPKTGPGGHIPPVVLDLDGDGVELISLSASKTYFDMNGDGRADRTGWAAPDDGFLVFDRDGDGAITSANEFSFAADFTGAQSDLEGLRAYDSNADGVFDAKDLSFASFGVWQDRNADGISQPGELTTLAERGIASISLSLTETGKPVEGATDNVFFAYSHFTRPNGTQGDVGDVFLAYADAADTDAAGKLKPGKSVSLAGLDLTRPLPDKMRKLPARVTPPDGRSATAADLAGLPDGAADPALIAPLRAPAAPARAARAEPLPAPVEPQAFVAPAEADLEAPAAPAAVTELAEPAEPAQARPGAFASTAAVPTDALARASALLTAAPHASLNTANILVSRPPASPTGAGTTTPDAAKLDRLIAAMASFHAGEAVGGASTAPPSPGAALAELAPAI